MHGTHLAQLLHKEEAREARSFGYYTLQKMVHDEVDDDDDG